MPATAALALADPLPTEPMPGPAATVVSLPKKRGPNTPEGKARSRQNALKHGLRAKLLSLPLASDDATHFQELADGLRATYRPEDDAEAALVDAIAAAMWQETKADRLEAEALAAMAGDGRPFHGGLLLESPANRATLHTVLRYQATASCAVGRAMRLFFQHRRAKRDGLLPVPDEADRTNELPPPAPAAANDISAAMPADRTNDLSRPDLTAAGPLPMPFSLLPSWGVRLPETSPDPIARAAPRNRTNDFAPTPAPTPPEPRHPGARPLPPGLYPPALQISRPSFASSE